MTIEDISSTAPTASTTTDALSPLEQMRAKIRDAEKEFAEALRAEFRAIYARVDELDDGIGEVGVAHFDDEYLRKVLGKVLKGLAEVVEILSDDSTDTDEDTN